MNRFIKLFTAVAMVAAVVASCESNDVDDPTTSTTTPGGDYVTSGTVLYVSAPTTRVAFSENEDSKIEVTWEDGDKFSLYDSTGVYVDDFVFATVTSSDDEGTTTTYIFTSSNPDLDLADGKYSAIYPATSDYSTLSDAKTAVETAIDGSVYSQDAGNTDDIKADLCYMLAENFEYSDSSDTTVTFEHQMAIMTFKFSDSGHTPSKLVFSDGDTSDDGIEYTAIFTDNLKADDDGIYTSHIMMNPNTAGTSRDLTFSLYESDDADAEAEAYYEFTVNTSTSYEEGVRYTASLPDIAYVATNTTNAKNQLTVSISSDDTDTDTDTITITITGTESIETGTYEIYTAKGLAAFRDLVNGSSNSTSALTYNLDTTFGKYNPTINGKLRYDIDLSPVCYAADSENNISEKSWVPISSQHSVTSNTSSNMYQGVFDGNGHKISNLYINSSSGKQGLFAYTYYNGVICNVGVSGTINTYNSSDNTYGVTWEIGGIVSYNHGIIVNCYNEASITANANVGGIVGHNEHGYVVNCYNHGKVEGTGNTSDDGLNIGGLIGKNDSDASLLNSYNTGTVTGNTNVGGTVGNNETYSNSNTYYGIVSNAYYLSSSAGCSIGSTSNDTTNSFTDTTVESVLTNLNDYLDITTTTTSGSNYETYRTDFLNYAALIVPASSWTAETDGYPTFTYNNLTPSTSTDEQTPSEDN